MIESFDITLSSSREKFVGTFQRQGECILTTRGYVSDNSPETWMIRCPVDAGDVHEVVAIAQASPTVSREDSTDSVGCPVCFEQWHTPGVVRVETACKHSYCMKCIISVCNLTSPVTVVRCALCRTTVTLDKLTKITS